MLTRWSNWGLGPDDPFSALDSFRREMDRMFAEYDRGLAAPARRLGQGAWPRVELFDTGSALLVRAELPGVRREDLEITVHESTLTLKGKRGDDAPEGYTAHRRERGAVEFTRTFGLPTKVDQEQAHARLRDGVLLLSLAKAAEVQPRQIPVSGK